MLVNISTARKIKLKKTRAEKFSLAYNSYCSDLADSAELLYQGSIFLFIYKL